MLRLIAYVVLLVLATLSVAASAPDSMSVAVNIVTILLMIAAPFLPLKQIKLSGPQMVLVSMLLAFVVAVIAAVATNELTGASLQGGAAALLLTFAKLWAIQQAVFQLLKDNPKVAPLLTDASAPAVAKPA